MNAAVDEEICLGCGVCKVACKQDALHMLRRQKRTLTPVDTLERVLRMAVGRGTVHDLLFDEHDGPTMAFANRLVGAIERLPLTRRAVLNETLRSRFVAFLSSVARKDRRVPAQVYE
jgi:Fe-S-cluster-containing hydrogenase component 2